MDTNSKILIILLCAGILISSIILYRNTMIKHNFPIIENESGTPEIEE